MTGNEMRAAFPFIRIGKAGPELAALRCEACQASFLGEPRLACARCGAGVDRLRPFTPSHTGTLHAGSIVHRGYPGVPVPFISAIVDLDDGPTMKGTLLAASFEPDEIVAGRRVRVIFRDALGRTDAEGHRYISHFFEPLEPEALS